ncbi:MAG: hypothetical protein QXM76_01435 [Zestosphaera sp.]
MTTPLKNKKYVVWCEKASKSQVLFKMTLVKGKGDIDVEWFGEIGNKFIDFSEALRKLLARNGVKREDTIIVTLDEPRWVGSDV